MKISPIIILLPAIIATASCRKNDNASKVPSSSEVALHTFPYFTDGFGSGTTPMASPELEDIAKPSGCGGLGPGDEDAKNELLEDPNLAIRESNLDDADSFGSSKFPSRWRAGESLMQLRRQLQSLAPQRSKSHDGMVGDPAHRSRNSDHNPWIKEASGVGIVTAYDVTHAPDKGCDAGVLAQSLIDSRDKRIKYVIWNRRIANRDSVKGAPPWAWRPYSGSNPHDKHLHLSVLPGKDLYDSSAAWNIKLK